MSNLKAANVKIPKVTQERKSLMLPKPKYRDHKLSDLKAAKVKVNHLNQGQKSLIQKHSK